MKRRTYTLEEYERVMSMKGRLDKGTVARVCKVDYWAVHRWWYRGEVPRSAKHAYRQPGVWHPIFNPDPSLIPVTKLWFHTYDVLNLIGRRVGLMEAHRELRARGDEPGCAGADRLLQRMRNDSRPFFKFLAVENLLGRLGLSTNDLPEPVRHNHLEVAA